MYKLLTEEAKRKVGKEYAARRAVVMLASLFAVLAIAFVGLFPSYILSTVRKEEVAERMKVIGSAASTEEGTEMQEWIRSLNVKLQFLNPQLDRDRASEFIQKVLAEKPAGVRLTSFRWSREKEEVSLSISGIASDRQTLLAFESRLNATEQFSDVTLPVSNLAQDRNINFQLMLKPK